MFFLLPIAKRIRFQARKRLDAAANFSQSGWARICTALLIVLGYLIAGLGGSLAQELQLQRSPFSAYLDLRPAAAGAPVQTVPDWIESFEFRPASATQSTDALPSPDSSSATKDDASGSTTTIPAKVRSVFRIRVERPKSTSDDLQMRVFFEDQSLASRPHVTAWDELGTELMRSPPLGEGLGLATSETLTVPMNGVNYLEIETSNDGSQVRGVFFSWLEKAQIRQPIDFPNAVKVTEPFQILSSNRTFEDDSYLYGSVTASLQKASMVLTAATPSANIQFELERQPLVAIVSYEVLGVSVNDPPVLRANSRSLGTIDLTLPDLADLGYQGQSRSGEMDLRFHYTGWIHAQKVIPGRLLLAGLNELNLELSNGLDSIAVRSVEIQLKYNWEKLDYVLAPAPNTSTR